ncbi:hypothetical protein BH10PSE18_BH10PSE18_50810 [soil metagenome]
MAERLEKAFSEAGANHATEIHAGAAHGWMVTYFPVFDPASAERGWAAMPALFERTLRK